EMAVAQRQDGVGKRGHFALTLIPLQSAARSGSISHTKGDGEMNPEDNYEILDKRFARLFNGSGHVDKLFTGCRWAEGPVYFAAGRYLLWSDIPNDRMLRYDETDGSVSVFREPAGNSNGNTTDREGRLVTCEHGGRRVSRTEHDGSITTLADK